MTSPTQIQGSRAEDRAAQLFERSGLTIIARNLRCRCGELDVIARDQDVLVIAEVRQRCNNRFGGAAASISWAKRRRILCATQFFMRKHPEWNRLRIRFDAVVLDSVDGELQWIRHAFTA